MDDISAFFDLVYSTRMSGEGEDKLYWRPSKKGVFTARSFYHYLNVHNSVTFPWKSIWKTKAPLKAAFFVWTASWGNILTIDNLRKRGIITMNWCYMCKKSGESVDHLLLHCEIVRSLWSEVLARVGLAWVMPEKVSEFLASWRGIRGNSQIAYIWKMLPICLWWCIWRERNARCFEDQERSMEELRILFFNTLLHWSIVIDFQSRSFHDFLVSLS